MPRPIKVPTPAEETVAIAENGRVAALSKLAAAETRIKLLEKQRAEALASLEASRATRRVDIPIPERRRARARGDRVRFIFGDVHGLNYDAPAFAAMLADMARFNPDEVIMGGDGVNCGGFLAQHHVLGYVAETEATYEGDIVAANAQLDAIQKAARKARVEWIEGNHDERPEKWVIQQTLRNRADSEFLRRLVAPEVLLDLKARGIPYHRRSETHDGLTIPGWIKRGKVFFTHEISSAKNAASAAVASTGGNLVYFHTHRQDSATLVLPGVGLIAAWCPGCLCQRQPLWRHSHPTHWTHGYAVQLIAPSGNFLHVNVLIENGRSLVGSLLK